MNVMDFSPPLLRGLESQLQSRRRHSARENRIGEIEVLRAIAVSLVLVEHLPFNLLFWQTNISDRVLNQGGFWTGVDLFFAISGFVIARALLPRLESVTDVTKFMREAIEFWLRRAWRLLPSAWFWLAAPLVLCLGFNRSGAYGTLQSNWEMFVAGLLNLANFHVAMAFGHYGTGTAFVQWSLSLEEQFYLALPLAAFVFRRYLPIPLLLIAASAFVIDNTPFSMMVRGGPVALGVLLALWSRHQTYWDAAPVILARHRAARIAALVLGVACIVSLGSRQLHIIDFYQGPIAAVSIFLVWLASYNEGFLWRPGLPRRVMEGFAARSYSLYLVHVPVYFGMHEAWFRMFGPAIPTHRQAVIYLALTVLPLAAVTELNHRLLERPLREYGKQVADAFRTRHQEAMA